MLTALIMLTSVGILIAFGDWLYRNMPDALGNSARKLSDGESAKLAANCGEGRVAGAATSFARYEHEGPSNEPLGGGF